MCGIVGQLAFGELSEAKEKIRRESMIFLGSELLQLTQERGRDATGVALLFEDGNYLGLKMGIPPIEFLSRFGKNEKEYGGIVKTWRMAKKSVRVFLGHCRKKTKGDALNNNNNHPIKVGDVIGIHNGTLDNDYEIFNNLGCDRDGEVDSEAIIRLLHHFSKNGREPMTCTMMKEIVQRLDGKYAVLGMSGNNPYQVCAFRDTRPLEMALIRPLSLVVCASEKKFIETALFRYNKYGSLYMPDVKFPMLTKADVEYKDLPDDSALVFDLRTKITTKTDIGDLYNWEKMPRTLVEGYKKAVIYYRGSGNNTLHVSSKTTTVVKVEDKEDDKKKEEKASDATLTSKSCGKIGPGRVWSKKANKYVSCLSDEEIKETQSKGAFELDVGRGEVEDLTKREETKKKQNEDDETEGEFRLEYDKRNEDGPITGAADIRELNPQKNISSKMEEVEIENVDSASTVDVDVSNDPEAIEAAEEAIKSLALFESEEEILDLLEIVDSKTLESLPAQALANRMKKFISKSAFMEGYCARKNEEKVGKSGKESCAEENIRNLKTFAVMCENILKMSGVGIRDSIVERAVIKVLEDGRDLSRETLDKVFTSGDDKNSEIVPLVKRIVKDKKNR